MVSVFLSMVFACVGPADDPRVVWQAQFELEQCYQFFYSLI